MILPEINFRMERFIADKLAAVTGLQVVPEQGDDELDPPYVVISAGEGEEIARGLWIFDPATAIVVTHINDTRGIEHSQMVRQIREQLWGLNQFKGPQLDDRYRLVFSGLSVLTKRTVADGDAKSHGDVTMFAIGVSELEAAP